MSGSGNDSFASTGTANTRIGRGSQISDANDDSCSKFSFNTTVGSPDPSLLGTIKTGDQLSVGLIQQPSGVEVIALKDSQNNLVGGLTPSNEVEFLKICIQRNQTQFIAIVQDVSGSLIKVHVKAV